MADLRKHTDRNLAAFANHSIASVFTVGDV